MKNIRIHKKRWISICLLMMLFTNAISVQAASYDTGAATHQILFALDGSSSMAKDNWQEAVDFVATVAAMLPSNYETAVMVYNEDVVVCTDFGQTLESQLSELQEAEKRGYTNTGLAVDYALERFSEGIQGQKRIVILSDGEISMKGQPETEEARMLYENAVADAQNQNVKIDVLLFEAEGIEEQISYGPETTDGFVFRKTEGKSVEDFAQNYLFEQLGLERIMLGASDTSEHAANISLQDAFSEQARILLVAESRIEDIKVTCQCKDIQITRGGRFAVVHLDSPIEKDVALQYTLAEKGKVSAYLTKEYHLSVDMEASYEEELLQHIINVRITDAEGNNILADKGICEKIEIYINGSCCNYTVEQEKAVIHYQVEESQEISLKVDFSNLNSVVFCSDAEGNLLLELPPPEPEDDGMQYFWLCVVVSGVCVVFAILSFLLVRAKKKTKKSAEALRKPQSISEILKYDFSGKIVVYMLKNAGGEDMPPASVNLYKRESREPFSFQWIKDKCRIDAELKDAEKIMFYGGENHTLCIRNNGDATLFNGKDILLKNKKYTLNYNEKLLMIFQDGEIELEVHYKNIKPSERER